MNKTVSKLTLKPASNCHTCLVQPAHRFNFHSNVSMRLVFTVNFGIWSSFQTLQSTLLYSKAFPYLVLSTDNPKGLLHSKYKLNDCNFPLSIVGSSFQSHLLYRHLHRHVAIYHLPVQSKSSNSMVQLICLHTT